MYLLSGDIINKPNNRPNRWAVINKQLHYNGSKMGGDYILQDINRKMVVIKKGKQYSTMNLDTFNERYSPIGMISGPTVINMINGVITLDKSFVPTRFFKNKPTGVSMTLPDGTIVKGNLNGNQIMVIPQTNSSRNWNIRPGQQIYVYDPPYFHNDFGWSHNWGNDWDNHWDNGDDYYYDNDNDYGYGYGY